MCGLFIERKSLDWRMKKKYTMKRVFVYILVTIIFWGCIHTYSELGNKYIYDSGTIAKVEPEENGIVISSFVITSQVLNFSFDHDYIVAYQIPDNNCDRRESMRRYATESQLDSLDLQFEMMKRIHHCYWIIRLRDDAVFGPMTKADFQAKCKELGVKAEMDPKYESDFLKSLPLDSVRPSNIRCTGGGAQGKWLRTKISDYFPINRK